MVGHRLAGWLVPAGVAALAAVVFLPSLRNGFVSWDDSRMFQENPHHRGLGLAALYWSWTTFHLGEYMPVTWMTYGADYALWGLDPFGYHLTNLGLHVLMSIAVYFVARRLLVYGAAGAGASPVALSAAAGVAAVLFAVHPLRAEPVAWVSARGSILGGLFAVLTVSAYLVGRARSSGDVVRREWYLASLGLFALALLSRSTNVMLPAVLLVLDVYPLRRLGRPPDGFFGPAARRVYGEKLPFLVLAGATVPLAILARIETEGVFGRQPVDPVAGAAVASFGLARYLGQTLLLTGLSSPLNEMPPRLDPTEWRFILAGALVFGITLWLVVMRRRCPAVLAGWVFYAVVLVPTLGVVPFGVQLTADRYTYVSCLGWTVLAGAGWLAWWMRWRRGDVGRIPWATSVILLVTLIGGLGALSWHRVDIWRDSKTLWRYTLSLEPRAVIAHQSLGLVLERDRHFVGAERHFRQAVELRPHDATLRTNLGRTLARQGRLTEAVAELETAVRLGPEFADAYLTLGGALAAQGRLEEALEAYDRAARLRPESAAIHYNRAQALAGLRRFDEAVEHYQAAVRLVPDFAEAHANLALVLRRLKMRRERGT